jgi:NAD(P)H dehydrogenase (quinone)
MELKSSCLGTILFAVGLSAILMVIGCAPEAAAQERKVTVLRSELPAVVRKAIEDAFPKGRIIRIQKEVEGKDPGQYDVDIRDGAKEYEVEISPKGKVIEIKEKAAKEAISGCEQGKKGTADVLIAYDSLTGNTERMAQAVAEGVKRVPRAVAAVKRVGYVTREDLEAADAIVLGCPAYYANIPGRMKTVIDDWSWKMKVDFTDKVGGAFATGGGQMGGKEYVVISLLLFMINNRMIVAGPLYQDEEGQDIWAEVGAGAMTGPIDPGIGPKELDSAIRLGERVAHLAVKLEE